MATELIAVGNTAANSADLVVEAGAPVTVCLKEADDLAIVLVMLKDDAGQYHRVGSLSLPAPAVQITAAGTYRLSRLARGTCGVFSA